MAIITTAATATGGIDYTPPAITSTLGAQQYTSLVHEEDYFVSADFTDYYTQVIEVTGGFCFLPPAQNFNTTIGFATTITGVKTEWAIFSQIWTAAVTSGYAHIGVINGNLAVCHRPSNTTTDLYSIALFDAAGLLVSNNVTAGALGAWGVPCIGNNEVTFSLDQGFAQCDSLGVTTTPYATDNTRQQYDLLMSTSSGYVGLINDNTTDATPSTMHILSPTFTVLAESTIFRNILTVASGIDPGDINITSYVRSTAQITNSRYTVDLHDGYTVTGDGVGIIFELNRDINIDNDIATCITIVDDDNIIVTTAGTINANILSMTQVIEDGAVMKGFNYDGGIIYALRHG